MATQNVFQIDYTQTTQALMPPDKRTPIHFAWLSALSTPLQNDHNYRFNSVVPSLFQQAHYNSQKIVLTAILNNTIISAVTSPYIYIVNNSGATNNSTFIYGKSEPYKTVYIYSRKESQPTAFLNSRISGGTYQEDFTVFVPNTYSGSTPQIRATLNEYAIAGVTWEINYY